MLFSPIVNFCFSVLNREVPKTEVIEYEKEGSIHAWEDDPGDMILIYKKKRVLAGWQSKPTVARCQNPASIVLSFHGKNFPFGEFLP